MRRLIKAAIISGIIVVAFFGYLLAVGANFDRSKVRPLSQEDRKYISNEDAKKSVDAALLDIKTQLFVARYDSSRMGVYVSYIKPETVHYQKYGGGTKVIPERAFLPDSSPVIGVGFDSQTGGAVPEHPTFGVWIEPGTYRVLGAAGD